MSVEASIKWYEKAVKIHEELLSDMKKRFRALVVAIPNIEQELKQEKQTLTELKSKGGK